MKFRAVLLFLAFATGSMFAADPATTDRITIVRVLHNWRDASSFKRIAEYFDGKEHSGGEAIARSHPEARAGYYFFVRMHNPGDVRPVLAKLQVISEKDAQPVGYDFKVELRPREDTVFHLGLTGPDWTSARYHPVAWKLVVTDLDGTPLATEASYLWEKPAK